MRKCVIISRSFRPQVQPPKKNTWSPHHQNMREDTLLLAAAAFLLVCLLASCFPVNQVGVLVHVWPEKTKSDSRHLFHFVFVAHSS